MQGLSFPTPTLTPTLTPKPISGLVQRVHDHVCSFTQATSTPDSMLTSLEVSDSDVKMSSDMSISNWSEHLTPISPRLVTTYNVDPKTYGSDFDDLNISLTSHVSLSLISPMRFSDDNKEEENMSQYEHMLVERKVDAAASPLIWQSKTKRLRRHCCRQLLEEFNKVATSDNDHNNEKNSNNSVTPF